MERPKIMHTPEVADRLRVPEGTLRYWRHIGFGPESRRVGRRVFYLETEVERWLADQLTAPERAS